MKNHGWTISATEYVEEPDFGTYFSDIEDDGYRKDDHDSGDVYDIDDDDDSDFWRRVGD
jgi:hypothetical protein